MGKFSYKNTYYEAIFLSKIYFKNMDSRYDSKKKHFIEYRPFIYKLKCKKPYLNN